MVCTYFMIVGKNDNPIYETELIDQKLSSEKAQLKQFILHAALDPVEELMWGTTNLTSFQSESAQTSAELSSSYLKTVDRFNDFFITAYVTPGYIKFLLMQDFRQEDNTKTFFNDVYELYLKVLLNPFYRPGGPITSQAFDTRVKGLLKKHF
eukprot:NODE_6212_length_560_cov_12.517321_g6047_i0.p1 GENE.NODE_6212_length_560_cov_12.517321_g6047_i0~~NODE_6212_length_560_cov_12.517321_g6047_i0.p1  ORF type:complete len:152 (+),score=46.96 NODE_6212_length_560_cov_12.517321_g6047_i0:55-510(+)